MSLRIPNTDPERWRFVEQTTRQFEVDINRLWRRMDQLSGMGEGSPPGDVNPLTYQPPNACPNRFVLEFFGNPNGGMQTVRIGGTGGVTADIPWDATVEEVQALLEEAVNYDPEADPPTGYEIPCSGGDLPNNDIVVTLPSGVGFQVRTLPGGTYLTRGELSSLAVYAKVRSCCGGG